MTLKCSGLLLSHQQTNLISVYKIIILIFKHFISFPSCYLSGKMHPSSYLVSCALNPFLPSLAMPPPQTILLHVSSTSFLQMLPIRLKHAQSLLQSSFPLIAAHSLTLDSKPIFSKKWSILVFIVSSPSPFQLLDQETFQVFTPEARACLHSSQSLRV